MRASTKIGCNCPLMFVDTVSGRQIHDANIVATMLAHGEHRLLTFNAADFRRYGNRIELVTA